MAEDKFEKAQRMLQIAEMMSNPRDAKKMRAAAEALLFGSPMTRFARANEEPPAKAMLRKVTTFSQAD
jgi:hypothetical protein